MNYDMVMPKLGESITEGTIIKWIKNEGDVVEKDEIILEISTDKVDSEIPTPVAGKISKISAKEGDTVEVGNVIAKIETEDDVSDEKKETEADVSDEKKKPEEEKESESSKDKKPSETKKESKQEVEQSKEESDSQKETKKAEQEDSKAAQPSESTNRFYSPVVLGIARTEGISMDELEQVPGTGINGRVSKKDVLNYLENRKSPHPSAATSSIPASTASQFSPGENVKIEPMGHIRKKIADHMVKSVHTSPHVGLFTEVDMTNIVKLRDKNKNTFFQREGIKLTYLPFISDAVIRTLKEFPYVNASIDGENVVLKNFINLGIAVATEQGLIVPVIKNAENLNVAGISKAINDLANRARNKKLMPDEVSGGTFSISNFGVYGTTIGFPLINQPQVAILGIGALQKKAVVVNDAIAIRPMMNISITFDHRLIDGEMGAKFLQRVAQLLSQYDDKTTI